MRQYALYYKYNDVMYPCVSGRRMEFASANIDPALFDSAEAVEKCLRDYARWMIDQKNFIRTHFPVPPGGPMDDYGRSYMPECDDRELKNFVVVTFDLIPGSSYTYVLPKKGKK